MIYKYRFYIWLIDTLEHTQGLTLKEIQKKWLQSSANIEGMQLTERTFNRYRRDAECAFNVDIFCDKTQGNVYRLERPLKETLSEVEEWLLSSFRVATLGEYFGQKDNNVLLEPAPPGADLLHAIIEAIDNKENLRFLYKSHFRDTAKSVEIIPTFVRLFKQYWYVVGKVIGKDYTMVCALDRIANLENIGKTEKLNHKWKKELSPKIYFKDCFGVIKNDERPITISFRAFYPQNHYFNNSPFHSSQKTIAINEDYTDYEIFVRPTYDLKQEFLRYRDKMAVLIPNNFRQEMITILQATLKNYETGENYAIDE